jgi:mono/diheme cytochrome c family protein
VKRSIQGGEVNGSEGRFSIELRGGVRSARCRRCVIGVSGVLTAVLTAFQVAAMPAGPAGVRRPLGPGSVWDSVFTLAQAGRGESTYRAMCASCHGDSLAGINDAPPLTGAPFHKTWDGNALSSLFNRVGNDMPSDNPGTLTKAQVAELVAFVLKYNGYPAGKLELSAAAESLSQIKFLPKP